VPSVASRFQFFNLHDFLRGKFLVFFGIFSIRDVKMFSLLLLLCFLLLLPGCGGGGGGSAGGSGSNSSPGSPANPPNSPSDNSVTLAWDAPTTRLDGSPVTENEINGYDIYWNQDDYSNPIGTTTSETFTVNNLQAGEYCFKASAVSMYGIEAVPTNDPVCKTFMPP